MSVGSSASEGWIVPDVEDPEIPPFEQIPPYLLPLIDPEALDA